MIVVDKEGYYVPSVRDESASETDAAIEQLLQLFTLNGWRWGGEPVTRDDIAFKVGILMSTSARNAAMREDGYAATASGRIRVEARKIETDSFSISVHVDFIVS